MLTLKKPTIRTAAISGTGFLLIWQSTFYVTTKVHKMRPYKLKKTLGQFHAPQSWTWICLRSNTNSGPKSPATATHYWKTSDGMTKAIEDAHDAFLRNGYFFINTSEQITGTCLTARNGVVLAKITVAHTPASNGSRNVSMFVVRP